MAGRDTPVMRQHADAKRAYPDAIIFFRLGDFYEMFGEDAVVAARALDLVLTSRNKSQVDEIPMCGIPHHAAHSYLARLLEKGFTVAICEQMADPAKCKGIVPREVVRVVTPGLVTEQEHLDSTTNNWLLAAEIAPGGLGIGVSLLDLSTGELAATSVADTTALLAEVGRAEPRELLLGGALEPGDSLERAMRLVLPRLVVRSDPDLGEQEPELDIPSADLAEFSAIELRSVRRLLRYARACYPQHELPRPRLTRWDSETHLILDEVAQRHLELVHHAGGDKHATLLAVLDQTATPGGARLLRRRLLSPLRDVARIRRRLDTVELFVVHARLRSELRRELATVGDLERLAVRAWMGDSSPRELGALRDGLLAAAKVVELLSGLKEQTEREALGLQTGPVDLVLDLSAELEKALVARPPSQSKEGAIFLPEYDAQLEECDALRRTGSERIVALEAQLRDATNIGSLKIRYTRVFGWYVEVGRSHAGRVPSEWRRKQTVATGERFTLPELDELAEKISHAEEHHRERELELFRQLVELAGAASERIRELSQRLSRWDVAAGLAEVAHRHDYRRPDVEDSTRLVIHEGRHPVVERLTALGRFVPNDCGLDSNEERLWLVTGPNMAGKSTFLRQVALIVVLAQMGSFVPAASATVGIVDRVLSRVGASDNLARGESTFMVEMRETSRILKTATRRSLVILDEIGRGTSTYDGLAIAWSVAEYLHDAVGCKTLFATHYHELTELSRTHRHAANYSVSAKELDGDVVFLHRLVAGAASRSYGVAVAKLAGLPEWVLARARVLLSDLEATGTPGKLPLSQAEAAPQLDLFAARPAEPVVAKAELEHLRQLDLDRLTPIEALAFLHRLKSQL